MHIVINFSWNALLSFFPEPRGCIAEELSFT